MADNKDVVKKGVEDLEKEITCAICHEHYTEPKVLPCCHYYCKKCIHHLALRTGIDKPFPCPECCKDTTLPEANVDNLPTAFFLNRMKEVHSKLELVHGKVEAKCESCLEDKAEAFCQQCTKFICAECVKQHKRMKKLFPGHEVSTLEELKGGGAEEILIQEPSHEACKVHKQPMSVYCYDCNTLICRDCTIKDHCDHNYEFVLVAVPKTKEELTQQLGPLMESQESLFHAIKQIQTTIAEVPENQGGSVANTIKISCKELHTIIDDHHEALLIEAATRVQQKVKHLSGQEKSLSTAYAVVQGVIEYTKQCLEHSADDEVMRMRVEMQSRIDREIQEQQKEGGNPAPVEEADMRVEVSCAEDLKQLCHSKVKLSQIALVCTITGEGVQYAEVNKTSEFRVVTNGKPTILPVIVECHLKSLASTSTSKCIVDLIEDSEYRIQYTPTVRGRHEVIVTVNGQEVAGSPFPVFVSIHPTQLGKPVQVISGMESPWHLALNPAGNIIVRDSQTITMLDKTGKKLMKSEYDFHCPLGVAVDSTDGCVYVTDNPPNISKIIKLSPDLKLKQVFESNSKFNYRGLSVVGDEVMVCCLEASVMVYTKELEYVRKIGSHGDGPGQYNRIFGLCSDKHSNVYVCYFNKFRVQVFSNGGEFLHSLDGDRDGVKKLINPHDVCVSGQYVYVTNHSGHSVSVFTTDGDYVTTFGQHHSCHGDLNYPCGVCVDKDGFVYVCDNSNNRIQIF